jgi:hypothetical protein
MNMLTCIESSISITSINSPHEPTLFEDIFNSNKLPSRKPNCTTPLAFYKEYLDVSRVVLSSAFEMC